MPNELENLFDQKMIPCPHCGTKNAEDAESCLLCGKSMQTDPPTASFPERAAVPASAVALENADKTADDPAEDAPPMDPALRKKTMRLWIAMAAALSLVLSIAVLVLMQTMSPAHDVIKYYNDGNGHKQAREIYLQKVEGKWPHQQILNKKMLDYFDKQYDHHWELLNSDRTDATNNMYGYIMNIRSILRTCQVPELIDDTRQKFDTIADAVYADYLELEWEYDRAKNIMGWIAETGYCSEETQARFAILQKVPEMEKKLSEGKQHEAKGKYYYPEAIAAYRQAVEHPRSGAEAQASADRCLTDYRNYVLNSLYGDQKGTLAEYEADLRVLDSAIAKLGSDERLEQERERVKAACGALLRQEVLAWDDADDNPSAALRQANTALEYFPGDPDILAVRLRMVSAVKQSLYQTLRKDAVYQMYRAWEKVQHVLQIMPEDPEMQQLKAQFDRYMENGLHVRLNEDAENPGFTKMFLEGIQGGTGGGDTVTDANGGVHDKFNLYQLWDTTSTEAYAEARVALKAGEEHPRLTFTVAPTKNFTGTGRIRVYRQPGAGTDTAPVLLYESPLLTGTSDALTVDLPVTKGSTVRIALEAESGTAEVLIDGAYIDNNPPAGK